MSELCAPADMRVWFQSSRAEHHFIWCRKCVRVRNRQQVSRVPSAVPWVLMSPYPPPSPIPSAFLVLISSLCLSQCAIPVQQNSGKDIQRLFIEHWCFFISLCLFVSLWSTEGSLAADVSSAALQRHGGLCEIETEKERRQPSNWTKRGN